MVGLYFGNSQSGSSSVGSGTFLAVGNTGTVTNIKLAISNGGTPFTQSDSTASMRANNGMGVFYNSIFYTPNGSANSSISSINTSGMYSAEITTGLGSATITSVAINPNNGRMVIVGFNGSSGVLGYADIPYVSFTSVAGFPAQIYLVKWVNDRFIALGSDGSGHVNIYTSTNGSAWTLRQTTTGAGDMNNSGSIAFGSTKYIVTQSGLESSNAYRYSADGIAFSSITAANSLAGFGGFFSSAYDSVTTRFYLFNATNYAYSTDPSVNTGWTVGAHGLGLNCKWAIIKSGTIVLAAYDDSNPFIGYSTNGTTYTISTTPFVAGSQNGVSVLLST